jgi:hypothetical protein
MMRKLAYRLVKTSIWLLTGILAVIIVSGILTVSALAKKSNNIDAPAILEKRFGIKPEGVKNLKGGGEMWTKTDLWLSFTTEGPAKPLDNKGMESCADMREQLKYFIRYNPKLPLVGEWLCFEKHHEKDPKAAGVWWMWHKEGKLNLYREWK